MWVGGRVPCVVFQMIGGVDGTNGPGVTTGEGDKVRYNSTGGISTVEAPMGEVTTKDAGIPADSVGAAGYVRRRGIPRESKADAGSGEL